MSEVAVTAARSPMFAFVATVLVPGLGHLYIGDRRVALAMCLTLSIVVQLLITLVVAAGVALLWGVGLVLALSFGFKLALAVDAARKARRCGDDFELRSFQRPGVYVGFVALSIAVGGGANGLRAAYVLDSYGTPSGSMTPTLREGDHFFVTRLHERARLPARGEVVVFAYPDDPRETFVKRVIGLPGDEVVETAAGLVVNGTPWPRRPCGAEEPAPGCFREQVPGGGEFSIRVGALAPGPERPVVMDPPGHVWVRGEHRSATHDSAQFGPITIDSIGGRARMVYWPLAHVGPL